MSDVEIYDSDARLAAPLEELKEIVRYRHLVAAFVRRDLVTRYKRSVLGVLWTMLNPLGTMLIMTVVFSQLFNATAWYPVYVLSGLITWNFFAQTTLAAPQTLLWSGRLIHRVYMPRTVFAFTAVGSGIVNILLALVPLAVVMAVVGCPFTPALLMVPVALVLLAAFALGVGLLLSSAVVYFPDIVDIYQIGLTAWLYLSAVFYPYETIPETYRWWFFNLNPMYHLMLLFRDPIYYGNWPTLGHVAAAFTVAAVALLTGWFVFTRRADEIAYRI
jgi:ABC-type polysaccharide/polyol phosphate export permease